MCERRREGVRGERGCERRDGVCERGCERESESHSIAYLTFYDI